MPELKVITQKINEKKPSVIKWNVPTTQQAENEIKTLLKYAQAETLKGTGIAIFLNEKIQWTNLTT